MTHRAGVTAFIGGAASSAAVCGGDVNGLGWLSANYTYGSSAHVHAVTSLSTGASYTYDANGNMTLRVEGGRTFTQTFDAENRLVSVAVSGQGTTLYKYNGDGQLTKQVNPDGTGTLYLGPADYVLNSGGAVVGSTSYYNVPGARVTRSGAGLFYILTDHLGSASVSLDTSGAVQSELRYDAFGATRFSSGAMPTDRLYTGQQLLLMRACDGHLVLPAWRLSASSAYPTPARQRGRISVARLAAHRSGILTWPTQDRQIADLLLPLACCWRFTYGGYHDPVEAIFAATPSRLSRRVAPDLGLRGTRMWAIQGNAMEAPWAR